MDGPTFTVVIPTVGRPSLVRAVRAVRGASRSAPEAVIVVDDRTPADVGGPLDLSGLAGPPSVPVKVVQSGGRGPAAARNVGWRVAATQWVAFVDDDVVPALGWADALVADLADLPWLVAGSQGRLHVPLAGGRRPTDWERNVAGLEHARWITADMAYRRDVLEEVGGFDERFPRAFREDADLGLRVTAAGYLIVQGERRVEHPVRPAGPMVSVRSQAGNADDPLMRVLHGPGWRAAAGAGESRNGRHVATTAVGALAVAAAAARRPALAAGAGLAWSAAWARFSAARIAPGPRGPAEVAAMLASSALIPPVATAHLARGWAAVPRHRADRRRSPLGLAQSPLALAPAAVLRRRRHRPRSAMADVAWVPEAVLFDRDGTLIVDVPGNTDPDQVVLMPGARVAVRRLRDAGLKVAVVTNQAAIGRGQVLRAQVDAINDRVDEQLGPLDAWEVCPHRPEDGCACRKPAAGLVLAAARRLGVDPSRCAVIGDIGSDLGAARAAGARSVLVPTTATARAEIAAAPVVAPTVLRAVDLVLAGMC